MTVQPGQRMARPSVPHPAAGRLKLRRALACFVAAYLIVTVLASATTIIYAAANHTSALDEAASSPVKEPSFAATVPYHVLIMMAIWPLFAWVYFRGRQPAGCREQVRETLLLSAAWLITAMFVDFIGFVLIDTPWSLTPHQFYVDYQPWITLIYAAIFASPWLRLLFVRSSHAGTAHAAWKM